MLVGVRCIFSEVVPVQLGLFEDCLSLVFPLDLLLHCFGESLEDVESLVSVIVTCKNIEHFLQLVNRDRYSYLNLILVSLDL